MNPRKVVYLTGAPASGKSTLIRGLARNFPNVKVFEYGREMSKKLSVAGRLISQDELRGGTDGHVIQSDIDELDASMAAWIDQYRHENHLIIDSHHVTIEHFGFRVAPFSQAKLRTLKIDEFWVLVLDNLVNLQRIKDDSKGRRMPTPFQANFHTFLQASLASQYAVLTGCPVYVFDSSASEADLLASVVSRLQ